MEEKMLKIIKHYGIMDQLKQFNEETYELIEAIRDYQELRYTEDGKAFLYHVQEELADVFVLINQFMRYYDIDFKDVEEIVEFKVDRQLERIEKGE